MKTKGNLSKNESLSFALGIAVGAIGAWIFSRAKRKQEGAINKDNLYVSEEYISSPLSKDDYLEDDWAVTPIIWGTGTEFDEFVKRNKDKLNKPEPYTREDVINFVSRYIKRVININPKPHHSNKPDAGNTRIDKAKEPLAVYLPCEIIEVLLKVIPEVERKEGGLLAMFAIDTYNNINKNQTFVLIPYGADKRVIVSDNNAYGTERWDTTSKKLNIIIPDDENGNINIDAIATQVNQYLINDIEKQ